MIRILACNSCGKPLIYEGPNDQQWRFFRTFELISFKGPDTFCPRCGNAVIDGQTLCSNCALPVSEHDLIVRKMQCVCGTEIDPDKLVPRDWSGDLVLGGYGGWTHYWDINESDVGFNFQQDHLRAFSDIENVPSSIKEISSFYADRQNFCGYCWGFSGIRSQLNLLGYGVGEAVADGHGWGNSSRKFYHVSFECPKCNHRIDIRVKGAVELIDEGPVSFWRSCLGMAIIALGVLVAPICIQLLVTLLLALTGKM